MSSSTINRKVKKVTKTVSGLDASSFDVHIAELTTSIEALVRSRLVRLAPDMESFEEACGNIMENVQLSIQADVEQFAPKTTSANTK